MMIMNLLSFLNPLSNNINTFEISVQLREDTLLKAARAFMVFEILEQNGDVIKSFPTVDNLEAEEFDNEFFVAFVIRRKTNQIYKRNC